ncbi:type II toxin-antitoxin system RelE/ParE family toxin [Algoriphagus sp. H41]|uniref:Type II toxin-antitoxin system RelE/ParE family toxin n=1 Tax=Algoriphagus oliviformis TaxID=2811231 RepID=A0ABS3C6J4_9BACT|nr:type II toxin-antitoxin system RelE/ParE family toxin [Algoriphagus oliviformis]
MVQINWTDRAVLDLKEIADYISRDSKKYAKIQIQRIKQRTQILKKNPFSGQLLDFFNHPQVRQLTEGNYLVIYCVKSETRIDIVSVHHASRSLEKRKLDV